MLLHPYDIHLELTHSLSPQRHPCHTPAQGCREPGPMVSSLPESAACSPTGPFLHVTAAGSCRAPQCLDRRLPPPGYPISLDSPTRTRPGEASCQTRPISPQQSLALRHLPYSEPTESPKGPSLPPSPASFLHPQPSRETGQCRVWSLGSIYEVRFEEQES